MVTSTINSKKSTKIARELAKKFYENAIERDEKGTNPKKERDLIRKSGLLKVLIPKEYGGLGGTWKDVAMITREFAKVDSSLAHVYAYHFVNISTTELWGSEQQKEFYYRETAEKNLFWGNAFNPVDIKLKAIKDGNDFILNGIKTFCTGSQDSDYLIVSAKNEVEDTLLIAVIPTEHEGIIINGDWDNMGQRSTDSGFVTFNNVVVKENEILDYGCWNSSSEFAKLRHGLSHFILNYIFLGIMEGAFEEARKYTQVHARAHSESVDKAIDDWSIQHHYGELYVQIEAARLLVEKTGDIFQQLWDKRENITAEERKELDYAVYTAKIFTTNVGLDVTSRMFTVMGSRATANKYRYDRFWRNLRTLTLHVPVDFITQKLGGGSTIRKNSPIIETTNRLRKFK